MCNVAQFEPKKKSRDWEIRIMKWDLWCRQVMGETPPSEINREVPKCQPSLYFRTFQLATTACEKEAACSPDTNYRLSASTNRSRLMCSVVFKSIHVALNRVGEFWVVFSLAFVHPIKCDIAQRVKKIFSQWMNFTDLLLFVLNFCAEQSRRRQSRLYCAAVNQRAEENSFIGFSSFIQ